MAAKAKRDSGEKAPSADTVLKRQVRKVRQSGEVNMFDRAGVQRVAAGLGLVELAGECERFRYSAHEYLELIQSAGVDPVEEDTKADSQEQGDNDGNS